MSRNLRKLENGRWEARERLGGRDSRRLSRTFDRKGDAERWVDEIRRMRQMGQVAQLDAGRQRLDEFIETYWVVHAIPNLQQSTRDLYGHVWEKHIRHRLGHHQLVDLTPKVVNRFRADPVADGIGDPTIRKALTVLQSVLSLSVTEEEIVTNPVARIRKPGLTPSRDRVPIPVLTIERMRASLPLRDRTLVSVMAYAGLRPQEALALRFDDAGERTLAVVRKDVDGRLLPYTKTRGHRHVRLLGPLLADLAHWQCEQRAPGRQLIFPRSDGEAWRETDYRNWRRRSYGRAWRAAGLDDSRPYDLRATWVSLMIFEGHTVVEVARQAGHSPETCLRHYARVFAEYDPADRVPPEQQIRDARAALSREPAQARLPGLER